MPIDSASHRDTRTSLHLVRWGEGWRIEATWWGFDVRGEKEECCEWVGDTYANETEARHALAKLQGQTA